MSQQITRGFCAVKYGSGHGGVVLILASIRLTVIPRVNRDPSDSTPYPHSRSIYEGTCTASSTSVRSNRGSGIPSFPKCGLSRWQARNERRARKELV
jgi:hypothetical protein